MEQIDSAFQPKTISELEYYKQWQERKTIIQHGYWLELRTRKETKTQSVDCQKKGSGRDAMGRSRQQQIM